ncbi:hypothetical protein CAEBREN_13363 [Caenorhabditis brenneri]|uniref:Uncharacterized protein n=1 Tax=Caenorhabditis brenneri TaxID=135651 RepID=G0ND87_CAEBE|nr:hypothetical protein CAEBREN_13363 [Caenorhabditis brenneri]
MCNKKTEKTSIRHGALFSTRFNSHGTTKTAAKTAKIRRLTGFCSKDFSFKIGVLSHDGLVELLDQNDTSIQQFHISGYVEDLNSLRLLRLQTECAVYTYNRNKKAKLSRAQKHVLFFFEEAVMFCIKRVNKRKTGLNSEPEIFEHKLCIPVSFAISITDFKIMNFRSSPLDTKQLQAPEQGDSKSGTRLKPTLMSSKPSTQVLVPNGFSVSAKATRHRTLGWKTDRDQRAGPAPCQTRVHAHRALVNRTVRKAPWIPMVTLKPPESMCHTRPLWMVIWTSPAAPTKLASPSMFNPLASSIPRKDSDSLMNGELVRRLRGPMDGIPSTSGSVVQSSSRMDETPKMRKPKDRKPKDLC